MKNLAYLVLRVATASMETYFTHRCVAPGAAFSEQHAGLAPKGNFRAIMQYSLLRYTMYYTCKMPVERLA